MWAMAAAYFGWIGYLAGDAQPKFPMNGPRSFPRFMRSKSGGSLRCHQGERNLFSPGTILSRAIKGQLRAIKDPVKSYDGLPDRRRA